MMLFRRYAHRFSMETSRPQENIIADLESSFNKVERSETGICIDHVPSSLKFWEGHGRIELDMHEDRDNKTIIHARIIPGIFHFDLGQLILFTLVGILVFMIIRNGFTTYLIIASVIMLVSIFVLATYLLALLLFAATVLSVVSYDPYAVMALVLGWVLFIWIVHQALRNNRRHLKKRLLACIRK